MIKILEILKPDVDEMRQPPKKEAVINTKVIFFNEINQVFKSSGTSEDWENFISTLSLDKRIVFNTMAKLYIKEIKIRSFFELN